MMELEKFGFSSTSINPVSLSMFLRRNGWNEDEQSRTEKVAFWTKIDDGEEEIDLVVPQKQSSSDYGKAIASCLKRLQEVESSSILELYHSIVNWNYDIVRIQADVGGVNLPLDEGLVYLDGGRELIQSSACAVKQKLPLYPSRKSREVTGFMQRLALGHSEPGSFVLKFMVPVPSKLTASTDDADEPFERMVSKQMTIALDALKKSAIDTVSSGDIKSFREAVASGVSGNLCQALSRMLQVSSGRMRINVDWSKGRQTPQTAYWNYEIDKSLAEVIDEAVRVFRSSSQEVDLEGMVVRLDRNPDLGHATTTKATLYTLIDAAPKQVNLILNPDDYNVALRAFQDGIPVSCSGVLTRHGKVNSLDNYYGFSLMDA